MQSDWPLLGLGAVAVAGGLFALHAAHLQRPPTRPPEAVPPSLQAPPLDHSTTIALPDGVETLPSVLEVPLETEVVSAISTATNNKRVHVKTRPFRSDATPAANLPGAVPPPLQQPPLSHSLHHRTTIALPDGVTTLLNVLDVPLEPEVIHAILTATNEKSVRVKTQHFHRDATPIRAWPKSVTHGTEELEIKVTGGRECRLRLRLRVLFNREALASLPQPSASSAPGVHNQITVKSDHAGWLHVWPENEQARLHLICALRA